MVIDLREQTVSNAAHRGAKLADGTPVNRPVEHIGEHCCHGGCESLGLVLDPAAGDHRITHGNERQRVTGIIGVDDTVPLPLRLRIKMDCMLRP